MIQQFCVSHWNSVCIMVAVKCFLLTHSFVSLSKHGPQIVSTENKKYIFGEIKEKIPLTFTKFFSKVMIKEQ
jgi:hypothetical protein